MTDDRRAARRSPLVRDLDGAAWGGVCAGLSAHLRLPVVAVRASVVGLTAVAGLGGLGYLLLWAVLPGVGGAAAATARPRWRLGREPAALLVLGAGLLALGASGVVQRLGGSVPAGPLLAGAVAVAASAAVWGLADPATRRRWRARIGLETTDGARRAVTGALVAGAGVVAVAALGEGSTTLGPVLLASAAVLTGLALVLAPRALRLVAALREERAARAEEGQRAEVAAHLHDSVLQTLAVIQRRCEDPVEVARLARAQERELRDWLFGRGARRATAGAPATVAGAVRAEVAAVEDTSAVPVELVVVGDRVLDRGGQALVQALREAVLNAARHGRPPVQVYLELGPDRLEAFVRDHGDGFSLEDVPVDRLGVRASIIGRMERAGGTATLRTAPGGGTEVALALGQAGEGPGRGARADGPGATGTERR